MGSDPATSRSASSLLDLVGSTPLVELTRLAPKPSVRVYAKLEAQLFDGGALAPFVNVYLGGEDVRTLDGLETRVNGSSMILLPAMAGGS